MEKKKYTIDNQNNVVVFVLGMRIHKSFMFHHWIPIVSSMSIMLRELYTKKHLGFLHSEFLFSWKGITLIQYWESYEQLESYAYGENHSKIWKHYMKKIMKNKSVGVFHETYLIENNKYEGIYLNMPKFGLAKTMPIKEIDGHNHRSRDRLI